MNNNLQQLIEAEKKASILFKAIEERGLICAGKTEHELNKTVFDVALELFGIRKYWHKRIVRSGRNTLLPYKENPQNLVIQEDDILFFDFGPVFEDWEADFGRTYVLGNDICKLKMKQDVEQAWLEGQEFYQNNKAHLTGADFYAYTNELAAKFGWKYGNNHCGHLVGNFPHEQLIGEDLVNYIHPENKEKMSKLDKNGNERFWIYEIHLIDHELEIGGFFEQLVL